MAILRTSNITLPTGYTHLATDWEIANIDDFTIVVLSSYEDYEHLTSIVFNDTLSVTVQYYARYRLLTNHGYTGWTTAAVFTPSDADAILQDNDMPARISKPVISTIFNKNVHPDSEFTITVEAYKADGNSSLIATTWLIEDKVGNLVYSSIENKVDLLSHVVRVKLMEERIYRIRVAFRGTNNDLSEFSTYTIFVDTSGLIVPKLLNDISVIRPTDTTFSIAPITGATTIDWWLKTKTGEVVDEQHTLSFDYLVLADLLITGHEYVLGVRARTTNNISEVYNYPFVVREGFPYSLPFNLV